jgi:hypothetical protein
VRINRFHIGELAYLLRKLKAAREAGGSLLDHSMVLYGSGISDGDRHNHDDLPILLAGRAGGSIKPGRHLSFAKTPLCNLFLSLLESHGHAGGHPRRQHRPPRRPGRAGGVTGAGARRGGPCSSPGAAADSWGGGEGAVAGVTAHPGDRLRGRLLFRVGPRLRRRGGAGRRFGARLVLVHVVGILAAWVRRASGCRRMAASAWTSCSRRRRWRPAIPTRELGRLAREEHADLIVIGLRHRRSRWCR